MYLDGLSFLEEERDAWRPFEALGALSDEQLERPIEGGHGWTGRDLMAHLTVWQQWALDIARELAVGTRSETFEQLVAMDWEREGDALNHAQTAEWRDLPLAEVRHRFAQVPGELRGYLTVVPETRWLKHPGHFKSLAANTIDHYAEHQAELEAALAAAG